MKREGTSARQSGPAPGHSPLHCASCPQPKTFIAQALKRASEAKEAALKPSALSRWDEALPRVGVPDLASDALARYRERAQIPENTASPAFLRRLEHQGLLRRRGSRLTPTGFAFLLFGNRPREVLHHAGLQGSQAVNAFFTILPFILPSWQDS